MMKTKRILIVSPDALLCKNIENALGRMGCLSYSAVSRLEAEKLSLVFVPHVTIIAGSLPDGSQSGLVKTIGRLSPDCLFFICEPDTPSLEKIPLMMEEKIHVLKGNPEPLELLDTIFFSVSCLRSEKKTTPEISLRKKNHELNEVIMNLRSILEASPDPMVVLDKERRVQFINPAFTEVFGWPLQELEGMAMAHFIPEANRAESLAMEEMEKNGKSYSAIETRRYSKSGQIIPVSISASPFFGHKGGPLGSVCNIRDISSQKTLEDQLIQSQKMEAIGTLASGIAHDFNNILTAIFGNLDLALMDLPDELPARTNVVNISKAAHRAKNLVSQILSFSRSNDSGNDSTQNIHPHLIIKEALFLLRASIPATIEIRERIFDKTATIMANPTQFHQIIMNLCTNAHHAMMDTGGILSVSFERVKGNAAEGLDEFRPYAKLTISDTGCGMDEATASRIFDPYFTTKDKNLGTGLGLSMVRRIINDFNGRINMFTHPGHGTRFELYFPETGASALKTDSPALEIDRGSGNILFVDDEKDITDLGVCLLQRLGYSVTSSTHPLEALERVQATPKAFDMVITDMTMPKMTGIRLAQALKQIRPDLPIILCTGFNQTDISDTIDERIIEAVLKKPVGISDFSKTITHLLARARNA